MIHHLVHFSDSDSSSSSSAYSTGSMDGGTFVLASPSCGTMFLVQPDRDDSTQLRSAPPCNIIRHLVHYGDTDSSTDTSDIDDDDSYEGGLSFAACDSIFKSPNRVGDFVGDDHSTAAARSHLVVDDAEGELPGHRSIDFSIGSIIQEERDDRDAGTLEFRDDYRDVLAAFSGLEIDEQSVRDAGEDDTNCNPRPLSSFSVPDDDVNPIDLPTADVDAHDFDDTPLDVLLADDDQLPAAEQTRFKHWSEEEDALLKLAIEREYGDRPGARKDWKKLALKYFTNSRSSDQCKIRWKVVKPGIVRGAWEPSEDEVIVKMIASGAKWFEIAEQLPGRTGESVRQRYVNFVNPTLKKAPWTVEEDTILFDAHAQLGNKWADIAKRLPGRSANSIKNRFHNHQTSERRRLKREAPVARDVYGYRPHASLASRRETE
jgi:Myb-like DNA-binding domain